MSKNNNPQRVDTRNATVSNQPQVAEGTARAETAVPLRTTTPVREERKASQQPSPASRGQQQDNQPDGRKPVGTGQVVPRDASPRESTPMMNADNENGPSPNSREARTPQETPLNQTAHNKTAPSETGSSKAASATNAGTLPKHQQSDQTAQGRRTENQQEMDQQSSRKQSQSREAETRHTGRHAATNEPRGLTANASATGKDSLGNSDPSANNAKNAASNAPQDVVQSSPPKTGVRDDAEGVVMVGFHSDSCKVCQKIAPVVADEVIPSFQKHGGVFHRLDLSTDASRKQAESTAKSLKMGKAWEDNKGSTGFVMVFNRDNPSGAQKLHGSVNASEYQQLITQAARS